MIGKEVLFAYTGLSNRPGPMSSDAVPLRKASLDARVSLGDGGHAFYETNNPSRFKSVAVKKRRTLFIGQLAVVSAPSKSLSYSRRLSLETIPESANIIISFCF